jgi:hypothetical protein
MSASTRIAAMKRIHVVVMCLPLIVLVTAPGSVAAPRPSVLDALRHGSGSFRLIACSEYDNAACRDGYNNCRNGDSSAENQRLCASRFCQPWKSC